MIRIILTLSTLVAVGCLFEPERKVRRIDCGTIDLRDHDVYADTTVPPQVFTIKDGACTSN